MGGDGIKRQPQRATGKRGLVRAGDGNQGQEALEEDTARQKRDGVKLKRIKGRGGLRWLLWRGQRRRAVTLATSPMTAKATTMFVD